MQDSRAPPSQGEEAPRSGQTGDESAVNRKKPTMNFSERDRAIVRLIGQHLCESGFNQTADQLVAETGCTVEDAIASKLKDYVMNGKWKKAITTLEAFTDVMSSEDIVKVKFLMLEQEYMELLDDGCCLEALDCLRYHITPLEFDTDRIHKLAGYLMYGTREDLRNVSQWEGKGQESRIKLLADIQECLPPNKMLPPRRLRRLLNQSVVYQQRTCPLHFSGRMDDGSGDGLLSDHRCNPDEFPCFNTQTLVLHDDEVWYCAFSPDGQRLASGSKDGSLIIYDVDLDSHFVECVKKFDHHTKGVAFLAWSPDSSHLLACCLEKCSDVWIYNVDTMSLRKQMRHEGKDCLTYAAWLPDSHRFVTGGSDGQLYLCDRDGNRLKTWEAVRVMGLCAVPDTETILVLDNRNRIIAYRVEDDKEMVLFEESYPVMSFCLDKTGRYALLNVANQGVHLWNVPDKVLEQKFQGMSHGNITTYSSFCGQNDKLLACGNEGSSAYIYHRGQRHPVLELKGHTRSISCIHWNPQLPDMLASASDDGTVRIWGPRCKVAPDEDSSV